MADEKDPKVVEEKVEAVVEATTTETPAIPTETADASQKEEVALEDIIEIEDFSQTAHDDFDWSISNRHTLSYTEKEIEDYLNDYDQSISSVEESQIVSGIVSSISTGDVVLDINFKSDGLVSLSEFRDMPDLKIGDAVDVYVEKREDDRGQLLLSRRKAKLLRAWEMLVDSYKNGTIIKGTVVSKTKGGLIVDCSGLETFLPGSQIDIKPIIDYDAYVGKTMEYKVVKINEAIKNAVVSHKALIESDLAEQREQIIAGLEKGQVLEGIVKNLTDFGAFMDLGGVDGLLYITDISWGRINHPSDIIELNQKLNVVVLDFDENKKRISLGLKQLQPHPWDVLAADLSQGSTVKGKIVNIEDYGAFLEITPGVEGLIHVSEVSWSNQPVNAREFFSLGQDHEAKVVTLDRDTEDPWSQVIEKFPANSKHTGEVKNLTPYGVFVELQEGVGGMVHISDLSWTKRYSHPSEFVKVGENIDVVILEADSETRKLSLGHKQLEENPWDTFENVFPVGSYHEATIIRKEDRGAIVSLPYGLEAFAPTKHLRKEDNTSVGLDETATFKVIEFNRDDKRIIVSHSRYLGDINKENVDNEKAEKQKEFKQTRAKVQKQNKSVEKTTLGELDVFSQLKTQMAAEKAEAASTVKVEKAKPAEPKIEAKVETPAAPVVEEKKEEAPAPEAKAEPTTEVKEVEPAAEEKKEEAAPAAKKADAKPDDLKKIEGIGPKISELMAAAGYETFEKMSKADVEKLKEVLAEAGSRYRMHDPTTWPKQAGMAAEGKWDELKKWQDELDGGK